MLSIFKRRQKQQKPSKPRAIAFVDYEHWFISLDKLHRMRPDIKDWRDELASKYELKELIFFADFSNPLIRPELARIREVSNYIIETQNTSSSFKKDFTDFIMLDHIYQKAMTATDVDVFILFTGDGHFNSVTNFLISQMGKTVGVYAVRDAVSSQLRNTASFTVTVPHEDDSYLEYYRMILRNMKYLQSNSRKRRSYPSFLPTVQNVARINNVPQSAIADALQKLIANGYINQTHERPHGSSRSIKVLHVNWEKCRADGIYTD
ncbi:MAG: NYN domain-containing protein [Clostridiales bacterium]|nr:NYN domain-containing protein [Clostridiales bacterium]